MPLLRNQPNQLSMKRASSVDPSQVSCRENCPLLLAKELMQSGALLTHHMVVQEVCKVKLTSHAALSALSV
jgi:hypothetical protein